jgi:uncharacterized OB-fold protein
MTVSPEPLPLLPRPDVWSSPFWEGCAAGELRVQVCASCGRRRMPPRPMCPWCRSLDHRWEVTSGRGRVWSFVVAHPPLLPAYAADAPYNVVVVELEEDPSIRFVGNVVTGPQARLGDVDPETITIGAPVEVCFTPEREGISMPRWILKDGPGA